MRYMLLMQATLAELRAFVRLAPGELAAHAAFMRSLDHALRQSGELVCEEGLAWPDQAEVVRAQGSGAPRVSRAPFPEGREFLAGYWVVDCDSHARAVAIAALISASPGAGGVPLDIPVEVRRLMSAPGEEM
jgi:hypothetical protein